MAVPLEEPAAPSCTYSFGVDLLIAGVEAMAAKKGTGGHRIAAACTAAIDQPEKYTNRPEKPTPPVTGLLRGPASSPDIDRELITVNPASRAYATGTAPTSPEPCSGAYRAR